MSLRFVQSERFGNVASTLQWSLSLVHDFVFPLWRGSVRWRVGSYDCSTATQNANSCPDGKRIAFTASSDGNLEIYLMNADGSGLLRLTRDPADDLWLEWSSDGRIASPEIVPAKPLLRITSTSPPPKRAREIQ